MAEARGGIAAHKLRAAAEELLAEAAEAPIELLRWKPGEGIWTVMDILCRIEEFILYWTAQLRGIVENPHDSWGRDHTDSDRLAAVADTSPRQLPAVTQAVRLAARDAAATLARLTDEDLGREAQSRNPRWDTKPASFIADHLLIEHITKHTSQIRRNAGQYRQHKGVA